jgi:hypothetical protein
MPFSKKAPAGFWQLTNGYTIAEVIMLAAALVCLERGNIPHEVIEGADGYQIWRSGGAHEEVL